MDMIVVEQFIQRYGLKPEFLVRAPGRVNLIGEHIDYNGYGVLPMALKQSIYCAVKVVPVAIHEFPIIQIRNANKEKYQDFETQIVSNFFENDKTSLQWYKYFLCGLQGCLESLNHNKLAYVLENMQVMVQGDIPAGSGLSSSSALVCAAFISTLKAFTKATFGLLNEVSIADCCAKCERYIGTEGGGMDQAICLLAKAGQANLINFNPLLSTNVKLPPGATFLISNCCVESNKAATSFFNERVLETRYACKLMAHKMNLTDDVKNLAELQEKLGKTKLAMLHVVDQLLDHQYYSIKQLVDEFDSKIDGFVVLQEFCSKLKIDKDDAKNLRLKLNERAKHVYSESNRVAEFAYICSKYENDVPDSEAAVKCDLVNLGRLMDESHYSCRDFYECSCEELDSLQRMIKSFGAYGSRLTGAGWGGCLVSLVDNKETEVVIEKLRRSYYKDVDQETFKINVFTTGPSSGAEIITF